MQDNQDQDTTYAVTTVTDDDDDAGDHHNNASNDSGSATVTAEQDRLRIAAEKRRQKILDQANTRMSIVEGTYNNNSTTSMAAGTTATSTETTTEMPSNVMNMESVVEDTGTETPVEPAVVDTPATDSASATTTATTSSTTSSKLAAMRRRRFQKKATPTTSSSSIVPITMEDPTTEPTSTVSATSAAAVVIDESTKVVSHDNVELIQEEVGNNATVNQNIEPEANVIESELDSKVVDDPMDTENATTTKKYLGVAKMRRRMIKERQEQQQQLLGTDNDDDDTQMKSNRSKSHVHNTANTSSLSTAKNIVLPKKYRPMITTLPILMYAVTTLLLFVTGLNIGLQQSQINYCYQNNNHQYPVRTTTKTTTISGDTIDNTNDNMAAVVDGYCYNTSNEPQWSVLVHSELAPRKMGGLQRLLSIMNLGVVVIPSPTATISGIPNDEELLIDTGVVLDDTEDEFSITEPTMKNTMHQGNIDPLFQVDLDALTAGDGLYFMLGRFAVRIHRSILTVVYYTPKSILQLILSIMWSFIQTPPILFIMALFIRHGLGKVILGAKLPKAVVDETQHKDILSTVKTFVTKFVLSSFPTITIFYDVWTYIRSDIYVILCGLFVGIALSHHHQAGSPYGETTTNTISNTFTTTHTTPMDGIADEL